VDKMKYSKLLLFTFLILFVSVQVSADRLVYYDVYERTFHADGTHTDSTTPINNVDAIGFVCSNGDCSSVSGSLWGGSVVSSGSDNRLELTFPENLQNSNGYAIFIYKDGYRTWEQNPNWYGTDSSDPQGPYDKYLAKVEECHAPVEQMSVLNDVQANIPLVINMDASLDAATYSALQHMGPVNYVPSSLTDSFYSVATTVTLEIKNWNGNVVHTDSTNILIPYSNSQNVEFTWTPTVSGTYTARIYTDITDSKCVNPVREEASSGFHVLSENPRNMCYTLINDLATSKQFPISGDVVDISLTKLSNYADNNYVLTSIPTDVSIEIARQSDDEVVYTSSNSLGANADSVNTVPVSFSWDTAGLDIGWYDISVTGIGNSNLCTDLSNLDMDASESIYLNSVLTENPVCGNDIVESGEECDDGNTNRNDGCSSTCKVEDDDDSSGGSSNNGIRILNTPSLNTPSLSNVPIIDTIELEKEVKKPNQFLLWSFVLVMLIVLLAVSLLVIRFFRE